MEWLSEANDRQRPRSALLGQEHLLIEYFGGWEALIWTRPSLDAPAQMVIDAGFRNVRVQTAYRLAQTFEHQSPWRATLVAEV